MRVYELAKKLGISGSDAVSFLQEQGFSVKSHMASISEQEINALNKKFSSKHDNDKNLSAGSPVAPSKSMNENLEALEIKTDSVEQINQNEDVADKPKTIFLDELVDKNLEELEVVDTFFQSSVLSRRDVKNRLEFDQENDEDLPKKSKRSAKGFNNKVKLDEFGQVVRHKRRKRRPDFRNQSSSSSDVAAKTLDINGSYTVHNLSNVCGLGLNQVVGYFLKKGKLLSANQMVPKELIEEFALDNNISFFNSVEENAPKSQSFEAAFDDSEHLIKRPAVVVIMGHVDHGKTSLVDHIASSSLVSKEKGGITQTVKAYPLHLKSGKFLVIDTPGHAAFSLMRQVGAQITDIAVIVVAADDGIMPQTKESIQIAKSMDATIIVAVNKIDKIDNLEVALDNVKQQLAQEELIVEDWGGDTILLPISAKTGKGVPELLEMIALQAELLELKADPSLHGEAFILESFIEKGLGACAVVIQKQGVIKVGDHFVINQRSVGKVRALFDTTTMKKVNQLNPYQVGKVLGLNEVASSGENLQVITQAQADVFRKKFERTQLGSGADTSSSTPDKQVVIILKADGAGVLDALEKLIQGVKNKYKEATDIIKIAATSVGNVYIKDIEMADEQGAVILGMNVSVEKDASILAKNLGVAVKIDPIVYRLSEFVEKIVLDKLKEIKELRQIGKGFIKKVFDIKGKGVIAGTMVTDGVFREKSIVQCFRDGKNVGQGKITSLQQNKKITKEISAGDDCGFICQGFNDWQENDKVTCFEEFSPYGY